jgi:hypothetical protein
MTKMTKAQTEYAMSRLDAEYKKRKMAIAEAHSTPEKKLSLSEKWEMVRNGSVLPQAQTPHSSSASWTMLFDWTPFERAAEMSPEGKRALADLSETYRRAQDEIMLGDAQEALELLRQFAGDKWPRSPRHVQRPRPRPSPTAA